MCVCVCVCVRACVCVYIFIYLYILAKGYMRVRSPRLRFRWIVLVLRVGDVQR